MKAIIDENIAAADVAFSGFDERVFRRGRGIVPADVADADALIVRSVTPVDETLLGDSPVHFVGSATIGIDHVDTAWLKQRGIAFAHAPGCNAAAVGDWVVATLAELSARRQHSFEQGTVGIVGAGNVGSRLAVRLSALGYRIRLCDPPRAEIEGGKGFVDLEEALACDVVTLHVPLTDSGPHATRNMIDAAALARMPAGAVLLNAARGGIIDEHALAARLDDGAPLTVALDCWAREPDIDWDLLTRVDLATPHIAGYSVEGRLRGTAMVAAAAAEHFGQSFEWDWRDALPPAPELSIGSEPVDAIRRAWPVREDDARLRALLREPVTDRTAGFDRLRRDYPVRREFGSFTLRGTIPSVAIAAGLGVAADL